MSAETAVAATGPAMPVEEFRRIAGRVEDEVGKLIVGQQEILREVLICLVAGGHALLEGVPGLGKTMLIRTLAETLDLGFSRIQFTPDLMPADITGTNILAEGEHGAREFRFQPGPIFANLVLADEINRATPKTQSALLEAMQEASVTVANETYRLPPPFFVLATQNPLEMEGTYPLPEAQLDRFMFLVEVDYPDEDEEIDVARRTTGEALADLQHVLSGEEIISCQSLVRRVPVPDHIYAYAARLVRRTRPKGATAPGWLKPFVAWGAGPRAVQYLVLGAKARAALSGSYMARLEDVRDVALPVLTHRVITTFAAQSEGIDSSQIVRRLLEETDE